ncbi:MAG: nucleotidyltransferase domain-containing protein [Thermoanaerobaculia bacterium]|nr:nucleotidyltransferase domain-containing protein [Thermoanaerobaculia bacterium]
MIHEVETAVALPLAAIEEICRRRGVRRLALFGSVLGREFGPESDVDFLVEFEPEAAQPWAAHLVELEEELAALLGRPVDVVEWGAVERSRNPYRRHGILSGRRLLYAA